MTANPTHFWKKTPFLRLLIALISGILLQWYFPLSPVCWFAVSGIGLLCLCGIFFIPFFERFRFSALNGIFAAIIFSGFGALLTWKKDIRNDSLWIGKKSDPANAIIVRLEEPPVEKTRSVKVNASFLWLLHNEKASPVKGKLILYFSRSDSVDLLSVLKYGKQIVFTKPLQEIKNAGNPGGFDYKRYALFQGITHQVFLGPGDFEIIPGNQENAFKKWLFHSKENILTILRNYIPGKAETGLAEALLIGYKHDLDQSLVQSYTNTGVVHIIAISGLHLGLIYWLLAILLTPLQKNKRGRWLRSLLIIVCLWLFSLLAGAQASILRSALMFTCIVLGESLSRKTSIYNTMAASAFLLLCINPYWIWDVGFQLSYAAVLSIVIFMKPVYNLLYIKNKFLDFVWKMNAVTLAAQVLTIPICIYHFHQFPNFFLLSNFIAVPLSSIILLGEILLCLIFFIPLLAISLGKMLSWLINLMNSWIQLIESIPFSVWDGLQINMAQTILLYLFITCMALMLLARKSAMLKWALSFLFFFTAIRATSFLESVKQRKIIVYNVPRKKAIDIVDGRSHHFIGDSSLLADDFARNFHLRPSRILQRLKPDTVAFQSFENGFIFQGKKILMIDTSISFSPYPEKLPLDLLIISRNPKLYINQLVKSFDIRQVVFDGSVPASKLKYWKKDCDSLSIPWHDVSMHGAFVMKLR